MHGTINIKWKKSVGPIGHWIYETCMCVCIMWEMKKCYKESRMRGISYRQWKRRKANWIGHILRRNCLLRHVIGGKVDGRREVTGRRGRRRKQLLYDLKETKGYCRLKDEALDRIVWRTGCARAWVCGPVVRQTVRWMSIGLYVS